MQLLDIFELTYPFFYLFFVCAFFSLGRFNEELKSAYWFGAGYACAVIGYLGNFTSGYLPSTLINIVSVFVYGLATAFVCIGLVRRTKTKIAWKLCAPLIILSVITPPLAVYVLPSLETQKLIRDIATGLLFVGASLMVLRAKDIILNRTIAAIYLGFGVVVFLMAPVLTSIFQAYNAEFLIFVFHGLWATIGAATVLTAYVIQLVHILKQEANTDPLTGLLNRRGFASKIASFMSELEADHDKVYILMVDLDNFKSVNDTFGHSIGDELICITAKILQTKTPYDQIVARIGGEEFAVAFTAQSIIEAKALGEHLRTKLAATKIDTGTADLSFTASTGIGHGLPTDNLNEIMDRADRALYLAKQAGRNCVMTQQDVALSKLHASKERNTDMESAYKSAS